MAKKEMLVNYVPGEECRIAIVEDGKLEEFYQERASSASHVSNIYKGRVTNVERNIQAAFVDFGLEQNGFLHVTDLHPMYFRGEDREAFERVGHKTSRKDRPPIERSLKPGQQIMVQVLKEGIGSKGPTLTSYLSIPGRFLVMMPHMQKSGVSRKIEDDEARRAARDILNELDPPEGFGFIVRTAGVGQTKTDIKRDLSYLQRLWKNIERKEKQIGRTGELYSESDLIIRTIRDVFTTDIDRVVLDDLSAAQRARDFLAVANPRSKGKVVFYEDSAPLFHRLGIEKQIEGITERAAPLPSGGSLIIEQTEALVAIDVNSGKSRDAKDAESNAYNTNMEAVDEICRQLRLRDLGGVVVCDLIDMIATRHRKKVEQRMRDNLKRDRARTRVGPISQFGALELTRQRMRPSLKSAISRVCPSCNGLGSTASPETVLLSIMRRLTLVAAREDVAQIELMVSPDVAFHLLNRKRATLVDLERKYNVPVLVRVGGSRVDHVEVNALDVRGASLLVDLETIDRHIGKPTDTTFRSLDDPTLDDDDFDDENDSDDATADAGKAEDEAKPQAKEQAEADDDDADREEGGGKKKRRRRRRRRRKSTGESNDASESNGESSNDASEKEDAQDDDDKKTSAEPTRRRQNARRDQEAEKAAASERGDADESTDADDADDANDQDEESSDNGSGKKKRRRRRRRRRPSKGTSSEASSSNGESSGDDTNSNGSAERSNPSESESRENASAEEGESSGAGAGGGGGGGGYSNTVVQASDA